MIYNEENYIIIYLINFADYFGAAHDGVSEFRLGVQVER